MYIINQSLKCHLTEVSDEQPIAHGQYMACQTFAAGESFQTHFTVAPAIRLMVNIFSDLVNFTHLDEFSEQY